MGLCASRTTPARPERLNNKLDIDNIMQLDETAAAGKFSTHEISAMKSMRPEIMERDDFESLLTDYREKAFKHKRSCLVSDQFVNDFSALDPKLKESVIAHALVINRSKRPNLFGTTFVFKYGVHNSEKQPMNQNFDLDALSENKAFNIMYIGDGYRMIFEYEHYREIIKYVSIEKQNASGGMAAMILPDMDEWGDADYNWIREHLTYLGKNSFSARGFDSAAAMAKLKNARV